MFEEKHYKAALLVVEGLWDAKKGTKEGRALDALVDVIEAYEEEHHPIGPPEGTYGGKTFDKLTDAEKVQTIEGELKRDKDNR